MSEVFGIACAETTHSRHEKVTKEQRQIFEALLLHSEDSGKDATGVFFMERDKDDSKSALFKIDLPAREFMKRGEYNDLVDRFFGKNLRMAIGHCRKASNLAKSDNKHNNHPILTRGVVGAHLGSVTNHRALWKKHGGSVYNNNKPTWQSGDVDSEVLFYMIGKQLRGTTGGTFEGAIIEASKELEGTYACVAVDLWRPAYVMLFTNQKEMFYYYSPSLNQIIFATNFDVLRIAMEAAGFTVLDNYKNSIPAHSGLRIDADKGKMRPFLLASEKVNNTEVENIIIHKTSGSIGIGI